MSGPALVPLDEARKELGLGRTTAYALAREDGQLVDGVPIFRIRNRYFANRAQLDKFISGEMRGQP